ncbi:lysine--tRNA ligase, partial [Enterococcus faecium]
AYPAYTDFKDVMDLTEGIISNAAEKVLDSAVITYDGQEVDLASDFARVHMVDAIKQQTGVDFWKEMTIEEAHALAKEHQVEVTPTMT